MNIPTDAWQVIGTVFAAMVAGLISFVVTILTKEQKTSEFRQTWIDALRQELSDFVATRIPIADIATLKLKQGKTEAEVRDFMLNECQSEVKQLLGLRLRILLRLNPDEHTTLINLIEKVYSYGPACDQPHILDMDKLEAEFVAESQRVLKKEWKRVKRGELTFFLTKWFSFAIFLSSLVFTVGYATNHLVIAYVP
jgi:hypothetical protein